MNQGDKKASKKKATKKNSSTVSNKDKNKNPKAFNVSNVVRTKRNQQRNMDKAQQKELIPLVNREKDITAAINDGVSSTSDPPPAIVVVMGPRGVGKSTLIRSLMKIYSGQNMTDTKGNIKYWYIALTDSYKRYRYITCPGSLTFITLSYNYIFEGPITVLCSAACKRRVTFFECPSEDICAMAVIPLIMTIILLIF